MHKVFIQKLEDKLSIVEQSRSKTEVNQIQDHRVNQRGALYGKKNKENVYGSRLNKELTLKEIQAGGDDTSICPDEFAEEITMLTKETLKPKILQRPQRAVKKGSNSGRKIEQNLRLEKSKSIDEFDLFDN
jgi:hypothetical protein